MLAHSAQSFMQARASLDGLSYGMAVSFEENYVSEPERRHESIAALKFAAPFPSAISAPLRELVHIAHGLF
jgi:hypothetical protein